MNIFRWDKLQIETPEFHATMVSTLMPTWKVPKGKMDKEEHIGSVDLGCKRLK